MIGSKKGLVIDGLRRIMPLRLDSLYEAGIKSGSPKLGLNKIGSWFFSPSLGGF